MHNQYLVDYTVRNITYGDQEDIRVLELTPDECEGFPSMVRDEIRALVAEVNWGGVTMWPVWQTNQDLIVKLLMPYISLPWLFNADYERWERTLLHRD